MLSNAVSIGNAGEHLVAARLLSLGLHVFIADRNNRSFDMSVFNGTTHNLLRIKTSKNHCVQWSSKKGAEETLIFHELQNRNDYCVFVLNLDKELDNIQYYIVPSLLVHREVDNAFEKYKGAPKKNGEPKKISGHRALHFTGNIENAGRGYDKIWATYKNNWDQLKSDIS